MASDTYKNLIRKTSKELLPSVLSFKRTQYSVVHNINIMDGFNRNLYNALKYQKGIPLGLWLIITGTHRDSQPIPSPQ